MSMFMFQVADGASGEKSVLCDEIGSVGFACSACIVPFVPVARKEERGEESAWRCG